MSIEQVFIFFDAGAFNRLDAGGLIVYLVVLGTSFWILPGINEVPAEFLKPVIHATFALVDAAKAHALMESGVSFGKVVLVP